jgi:hypothetical protein
MNVLPELSFAVFIAYFLPGVLALYAISHLSSHVADLFASVVMKDQTLGASLLILVASLAIGPIVSAFRALILDFVFAKTGVTTPALNYGALSNKETLGAYKEAINNTYRFYQFNANMFVSLALLMVVRYAVAGVSIRSQKTLFSLGLITLVVLFLQSRNSLRSTYGTLTEILGKKVSQPSSK